MNQYSTARTVWSKAGVSGAALGLVSGAFLFLGHAANSIGGTSSRNIGIVRIVARKIHRLHPADEILHEEILRRISGRHEQGQFQIRHGDGSAFSPDLLSNIPCRYTVRIS